MTVREGNIGNCHPRKTNVDRGEGEVDIGFRGVTISHVTLSCNQYLLYYTECQLNSSSTLRSVSNQSRSSEFYLYGLYRPTQEIITHVKTSPL